MTDLTCHYCSHDTAPINGPVVAMLIDRDPRDRYDWRRPVCEKHTTAPDAGYGYPTFLQPLTHLPLPAATEKCGTWMAVEIIEGNVSQARWCERVQGACPFIGSFEAPASERRCAVQMEDEYRR